ncbi:hypothetical protein QJ854_gp319 [Moumouvirus goulette]|uniref:Uncharacterized protein n=1 Tax=Moumouvirus goulette TaxID=1247379 RepID=M1PHB8_9VIRU|nr:hypothetical protein QJ854_gp319 [Moumouvirus goulette]AGF85463.1 hypothetical protein glt_00655 [Moumouvirus goulette]
MIRLAIIGFSGRDNKSFILTEEHYNWMIDNVMCYVKEVLNMKPADIILVSGGSSWSDHIAVSLFLTGEFNQLHLYLPVDYDKNFSKYYNNYQGSLLNSLHENFGKKINKNTLQDLKLAMTKNNCKLMVYNGFFKRNTAIANSCDHIIAFSLSDKPSGGTLDTWNKIKHDNKININLLWM